VLDVEPFLAAVVRWAEARPDIVAVALEYWGRVTSLRVRYEDGREVEYGITTRQWAALPLDAGTRRVIRGGMRILLDRQNDLALVAEEVR